MTPGGNTNEQPAQHRSMNGTGRAGQRHNPSIHPGGAGLSMTRGLSLTVAFLLELAVLYAVGLWGFTLSSGPALHLAVGVGAPTAVAVLWGVLGSPKARWPLHGVADGAFRIAWFGIGALAFWAAGQPVAALALAGIYAANALMLGTL